MEKIQEIERSLELMKKENESLYLALTKSARLDEYEPENGYWTSALQMALNENEIVIIPEMNEPYLLNGSVTIPSNRRIIADKNAVIRLDKGVKVLMLRNTNTVDGTHLPIRNCTRNENISIEGGIWEECCPHRLGYGRSGMYDEQRSFYGVSTCMLFENINHLTLKNMTFRRCGGFAVQIGEASNIHAEGIRFENCFADGLHINGNTENIYISDVKGEVGDDLVAFNMFDWQNSSINFGPCNNVICQDLELSLSSYYKALRIEPGVYTFDNGERVDCSLNNAIFRRIKNIKTYKLYCQTPPYFPGNSPEKAGVGSGDNIFFEDISINLDEPIDKLDGYMTNDPIKGSFAGFELGLNVKNLYFKNIDITLDKEKNPYSYLICIGPKSARLENGSEVFDPYYTSYAENLYLEGITVNGTTPDDISSYLREIVFDNLYSDIESSASGRFGRIHYKK